MTAALILAWLHYLAIMLVAAALVAEHLLFSPRPELANAGKLVVVDLIYGISLLAALATGVGRLFHGGKGAAFYMSNGAFHAKLGLFVVLVAAGLYTAMKFMAWRRSLRGGGTPVMGEVEGRRVLIAIRIQLLLLIPLPLLAAMMARGIGS